MFQLDLFHFVQIIEQTENFYLHFFFFVSKNQKLVTFDFCFRLLIIKKKNNIDKTSCYLKQLIELEELVNQIIEIVKLCLQILKSVNVMI